MNELPYNSGMQNVLDQNEVLSSPTITVRLFPAMISDLGLVALYGIGKPLGNPGDKLRSWLQRVVAEESARRRNEDPDIVEPPAWLLDWHSFNDEELAAALIASFAWTGMSLAFDVMNVVEAIHRACVTAAASRLVELFDAIEIAKQQRGNKQ